MIVSRGIGRASQGSVVIAGLGQRVILLFDVERRIISVPAFSYRVLNEISRLLIVEGASMDRIVEVLDSSDFIEVPYANKEILLAENDSVIVIDTESRTIVLPEEN